ncbi:MAG: trypsin-like peptidase domain-containing protein, partial [Piscinibacter sp.]|nr:trypsin-like peptidase domain-containing protein [Piscinibacter sp.]
PADPALVALLDRGEAALRAGDGAAAQRAYEQAVALRHATDVELGWLRAQLQSGEYRRALAFAAHVAGAHRDAAPGAALYAWLLERGAQSAIARTQLAAAQRRWPDDPALQWMARRLGAPGSAQADEPAPPLRLGPYPSGDTVPRGARTVASALRIDDRHALLPLASLAGASEGWLRDGLGRARAAVVERREETLGIAVLRVQTPWEAVGALQLAPRDAFAGSPAFALGYEAGPDMPLWPAMSAGLLGRPLPGGSLQRLGVELAASAGGPVFDHAARLVGMTLPTGSDARAVHLLPLSALRELLPSETPAAAAEVARVAPDAVYEAALGVTLQFVVLP